MFFFLLIEEGIVYCVNMVIVGFIYYVIVLNFGLVDGI